MPNWQAVVFTTNQKNMQHKYGNIFIILSNLVVHLFFCRARWLFSFLIDLGSVHLGYYIKSMFINININSWEEVIYFLLTFWSERWIIKSKYLLQMDTSFKSCSTHFAIVIYDSRVVLTRSCVRGKRYFRNVIYKCR